MSVESLRKEADRKRKLVAALEEEGRAEELRASAERATKRAADLRASASGGGDDIAGGLAVLAVLGCVGYWLFG